MIKLPLYILTWLGFLLIRSVVIALGLVVVPVATFLGLIKTQTSKVNGRLILNWSHKLLYPWGNDEDGILAGDELINYPAHIRIFYWSAIRNPANNLRFIKLFNCIIEPHKVNFVGTKLKTLAGYQYDHLADVTKLSTQMYDDDSFRFTTLTWCGMYSNLRIQFKMFGKIWRFWIGWKIYPHDKFGIGPKDYRYHGAGFATQFKRIYPRNK